MTGIEDGVAAEVHVRGLLEARGLPAPDEVEYHETEIVLLWHETKLAVVIEIDERPE